MLKRTVFKWSGVSSVQSDGLDIHDIIDQLEKQRVLIDEAIGVIQRLGNLLGNAEGVELPTKRRGRPPGAKNKPRANERGR